MMLRSPTRRPVRSRLTRILAAAGLLLGMPAAHADDVPAIGNWEHYRFTTDPRPVTVRLTHDSSTRAFPPLTVPRSYIYYAPDAPPTAKGPLPDTFATGTLGIAFVGPDGEAWSVAVTRLARERGVSVREAGELLRDRLYKVKIGPTTRTDVRTYLEKHFTAAMREIEPIDGMRQFLRGNQANTFLGGERDNFMGISCVGPPHHKRWCEYIIIIANNFDISADIADPRVHRSRAVANERTRLVRDVICRFLDVC